MWRMLCVFSVEREQITFTGRSSELTGAGYRSFAVTGILRCNLWYDVILHRFLKCVGERCHGCHILDAKLFLGDIVWYFSTIQRARNIGLSHFGETEIEPSPYNSEFLQVLRTGERCSPLQIILAGLLCRKIATLGACAQLWSAMLIPHSLLLI